MPHIGYQCITKMCQGDIIQIFLPNNKIIHNKKIFIHSEYNINLCKNNLSIKKLIRELNLSCNINSQGVIVHICPKKEDDNTFIKLISFALDNSNNKSIIILETSIYRSIQDIYAIHLTLSKKYDSRIKICIDTCHVWAFGHSLDEQFLSYVIKKIKLKNIACIHLNDSKNEKGSKIDRHADIGYGKIPLAHLQYFSTFMMNNNIPLILETPLDTFIRKKNKLKKITIDEQIKLIISWTKK